MGRSIGAFESISGAQCDTASGVKDVQIIGTNGQTDLPMKATVRIPRQGGGDALPARDVKVANHLAFGTEVLDHVGAQRQRSVVGGDPHRLGTDADGEGLVG